MAYWSTFAALLLSPTEQFARPVWQDRLRDGGLILLAVTCTFSMDGMLF